MLRCLVLISACFLFHVSFSQNCCHKRHWQADDMPPAKLMSGIGKNHFPISTGNEQAQLFFDQGIRLLHSYWDFEAYRAFKRASELDTAAAMPHLGIAMVFFMSRDTTALEGVKQMEIANRKSAKATQKEKDLIHAWTVLFASGNPDTLVYEMRKVCAKYPDDTELQLILANQLTDAYEDGKPTPEFTSCDSLLEIVLAKEPDNFAAHHYYIHNIEDTPFTEKGLKSAGMIAALAPNLGHIQHMPGHIYYHLGDYEAARTAFLNAKRVDSLYLDTSGVEPINHWNNMHNHIYLAFADIEQGRYRESMDMIRYLQRIETKNEKLDYKTSENARSPWIADMYLTLRVSDWDKCIELDTIKVNGFDKWALFGPWYRRYLFYYAHAMKAFDNKEKDSLSYYCKKMVKQLDRLKNNLDAGMKFKRTRAHFEKVFYDEALACKFALQGKFDKAYSILDSAIKKSAIMHRGDPPPFPRFTEETKVKFLVMEKKYTEAIKILLTLMETRRNSPLICEQIAETYVAAGNREKAKAFNQRAVDNWKYADKDFIPYLRAKKLHEQLIEK